MNDISMSHLMIDLETLGTRSNAVILSIGVAQFDLIGNTKAVLHRGITIDSCLEVGLQVDGSTIEWWFKQEDKNIKKLATLGAEKLEDVLEDLKEAVMKIDLMRNNDVSSYYVWSHGSNFDIVLLENAYKAIGQKIWWKYNNVRDTRTLFDVANYQYKAKEVHDALEDAMNQAHEVANAYQQLMSGVKSFGIKGIATV